MLSSDETKAGRKAKPRKARAAQEKAAQDGDKAGPRKRKAPQVPDMDQPEATPEQAEAEMPVAVIATVAPASIDKSATVPAAAEEAALAAVTESPLPSPAETSPAETSLAETAPAETSLAETAPADPSPAAPAVAEKPVSYRTIADAWGNYSRTSIEQTRTYFEKLAGVRSFSAAFELQAEFARQACETFVAQSQKIGELQSEMAKQRFKRLEGFVEKMTPGKRQS
jgi:hypothetical protein